MNKSNRYRRICFTLNNYKKSDEDKLKKTFEDGIIKYMIYGKEIAPKTNTPHLQGYIEFNKQLSHAAIKKIHNTMHFEASKGSQAQNIKYCSKEGNAIEFGKPKEQGKRNDLIRIKELVNGNSKMRDILNECDNFQQMKCAEKLMSYKKLNIKERIIPEVIYIHGKSGTGKTQYARSLVNEDSCYTIERKMDWFDGYDMDNDVIINDFRGSKCEYSFLLNLLDGYEMRVPIKGGFTIWKPKRVIFTSVIHPKDLYQGVGDDSIQQFTRRITKFIIMNNKYEPTVSSLESNSEVGGNTIHQPLIEPINIPIKTIKLKPFIKSLIIKNIHNNIPI